MIFAQTFTPREPKGTTSLDVAVLCWYPTKSNPTPTMLKIKTEESEIVTVKNIDILSCDYILHLGYHILEYHCRIQTPAHIQREIYLHYTLEKMSWTLAYK